MYSTITYIARKLIKKIFIFSSVFEIVRYNYTGQGDKLWQINIKIY